MQSSTSGSGSNLFSGLRFAISGLPHVDASKLRSFITRHGGTVDHIITAKTTHLITSADEFKHKSTKVSIALQRNIAVVPPDFVYDSVANGFLANVNSYLYTTQTTTTESSKNLTTNDGNTETANAQGQNIPPQNTSQFSSNPPQNSTTGSQPKKRQTEIFGRWRTARVFISSTFKDMHGERDYLTKVVFPELQERCNKLRVHVHPVDLRWGVTEEDTENALEICLTELDNCRPFFIGLLGQRYGWVPKSYNVPDEPRFDWLKSMPLGLSITHLEMYSGALRNPSESCYAFYLRDPSFMVDVPAEYRESFETESPNYVYNLESLKNDVRTLLNPEYVFDNYPCSWGGVIDGKPMTTNLEEFGKHVLETMWKHIQSQFPILEEDSDPLSVERSYHERFIESHSRNFVGRQWLLSQIEQYCDSAFETYPLVIVGAPGAGKTSLVSTFAHSYLSKSKNHDNLFVLVHFVGASPTSTNIRHTLSRLVKEIVARYDFDCAIPEEYNELKSVFANLIQKIGETRINEKFVLILDALNQLEESYQSHLLDWLPETYPPNVRVVVSTLEGDVYNVLSRRQKTLVQVGPLTLFERREIVEKLLWQYRKKLSDSQMNQLLRKQDSYKPLYLVVACEELRVFGVFEKLSERIESMAPTVPELFAEVLQRLETDHGRDLVELTLSLLTCSRGGLLENELLHCVGSWDFPLPQHIWAPLHRSMKAYLRPSDESGEGVLDFFHQQLPKAIRKRYLANDPKFEASVHERLAYYFRRCADPDMDFTWLNGHRRGLSFTAYHLTKSRQWETLMNTLCNLVFIEAKAEAGMTYDLVADYLMASSCSADMPPNIAAAIDEYQRFVQQRSHVLSKHSDLCFSMAASMPDSSRPAIEAASRYKTGRHRRPWMRWLNKPQTANPCIMTLSGHDAVVRSCAFSPSEEIILSAADDATLKLWNKTTGEEMKTLRGHRNSVLTGEFSPDGKYVASAGYDKAVKIWNVETGAEVISFKGHKGMINTVAWSPDGSLVVSAGQDKTVMVWNPKAPSGEKVIACIKALVKHERGVRSIAFSPDGTVLASASEDAVCVLWRVGTWEEITSFKVSSPIARAGINSVAFSKSGKYIVLALDDRTVRVMDATTLTECAKLVGHNDGVCYACMSDDENTVLSSSHDNLIICWDWKAGTPKSTLVGHTGSVFKASFSRDGKHIVSCSFDRSVKIWEVSDSVSTIGHDARILCVAFSPDFKYLATGSRDKTAKVWDVQTYKEVFWLKGHTANVYGICWSPDGSVLVTASRDTTLKMWNIKTGKCFATLCGHTSDVLSVDWSPNGEHLASCSEDKTVKIWNASKLMELRVLGSENFIAEFKEFGIATLYGHRSAVTNVKYSPSGTRLASCSADHTVKLWNTRLNTVMWGKSYVKVATFSGHLRPVTSVCWTPDCNVLVSASDDKQIIEWNAHCAKMLHRLLKHTQAVVDVDITPDGQYLFSGSTDSTCVMWHMGRQEPACSFAGLSRLCAVATAPNGQLFAAGDGSGVLYILTPVGL